jgi:tRNA(fMet)-specific endonuclease VapC
MIHFDSSFLIDFLRECTRERPGAAFDFIEALEETEVLGVSVHVVCELRAGAELSRVPRDEHSKLDDLLAGLVVSLPGDRFAHVYGSLAAATSRGRKPLAAMDVLIATAAVVDNAGLVTRNVRDFSRVPGLRVLSY